ncbi:metallophosphoesterase [Halalkalirubrum salinum]|uniref:metallophosphoesterase n=1 Tax=Halalkalirubrum salinum TaxID=2563889 RepID=UPI001F0D012A|nr:metallophosphoesterase [Halalkalirubrum salinum]
MGSEDIRICDRAAYLQRAETLVCADLHIGREECAGVAFPLGEHDNLCERLDALCARFDPARVVFAGDVLHSFSGPSIAARRTLESLAAIVADHDATLTIVEGNHDTALSDVWDGSIVSAIELEAKPKTLITHGHTVPDRLAAVESSAEPSRVVIGHDHPAIEIEGVRHPCFLSGSDQRHGASVFVLPAFNRLAPGVVVNNADASTLRSPYVTDISGFSPIVHDSEADEALHFPPLSELRSVL